MTEPTLGLLRILLLDAIKVMELNQGVISRIRLLALSAT